MIFVSLSIFALNISVVDNQLWPKKDESKF